MQHTLLGPDGSPIRFAEAETSYSEDSENLIIKQEQDIPGWFLDDLADKRQASTNERAGEFHHVAAIPEVIVLELKRRYGFDVLNEPAREILKMMRKLHLDLFIATNKRI